MAGLAALILLLAGLLWAVPAGPLEAPGPEELQIVSLRVSHHRGPEARPLGELGLTSYTARAEDDVRVHARLSGPALCYLIALNPDGQDQLCHPADETTPPEPADAVEYPARPDTYFGLTDGTGVQAFVLLAARAPLPPFAVWKAAAGPPPWQQFAADGVWWFDDGRFRRLDVTRGDERVRGAPAPLQALADFLGRRPEADAVGAVAFRVGP